VRPPPKCSPLGFTYEMHTDTSFREHARDTGEQTEARPALPQATFRLLRTDKLDDRLLLHCLVWGSKSAMDKPFPLKRAHRRYFSTWLWYSCSFGLAFSSEQFDVLLCLILGDPRLITSHRLLQTVAFFQRSEQILFILVFRQNSTISRKSSLLMQDKWVM
jgi:hypothetical protein